MHCFPIKLISRLANEMSDHLSATFVSLSDPSRRAILARLALRKTSVKELAMPFSISTPSISKYLKVLAVQGNRFSPGIESSV
jgi:DNA-binding transcriptional ArsR family regulator